MPLEFFDAHNHLHDQRLNPWRDEFLKAIPAAGVMGGVVNGTRESDWDSVSSFAHLHRWVVPSFGLHPWYLEGRTVHWREALNRKLDEHPDAGVGECGLDRWIEGHDIRLQANVFKEQLAIATERNRALSIHCIRAWGAIWDVLRSEAVPQRGFLLHAYAGPVEMVPGFAARGAYFSFSPYFLHARKAQQRDLFNHIPMNRLLVETDAPDMAPPSEENENPIQSTDQAPLNHPLNLIPAYAALAKVRNISLSALSTSVGENWQRLFHYSNPPPHPEK